MHTYLGQIKVSEKKIKTIEIINPNISNYTLEYITESSENSTDVELVTDIFGEPLKDRISEQENILAYDIGGAQRSGNVDKNSNPNNFLKCNECLMQEDLIFYGLLCENLTTQHFYPPCCRLGDRILN